MMLNQLLTMQECGKLQIVNDMLITHSTKSCFVKLQFQKHKILKDLLKRVTIIILLTPPPPPPKRITQYS